MPSPLCEFRLPPPRWEMPQQDPDVAADLQRELPVSRLCAIALARRGATTPALANAFLNPRLANLQDPWRFRDMDRAVERVVRALKANENICIYGDFDADGITATALLARFFRELGVPARTFLPDRLRDGYGLQRERLLQLRADGATLFIAVDCGTRSHDEAAALRDSGADLIVLDHHIPGPTLPDVAALVNPFRPDCTFPFKGLASVGIAFYFAGAVRRALIREGLLAEDRLDLRSFLGLVAVGTVADVVPLLQDNRILVHAGLEALNREPDPGFAALRVVAGVADRPVTTGVLGFQIGPRLNAIGRLGDATAALDLLIARDVEEAARLATVLDQENSARRRIEVEVLEEVLRRVQSDGGPAHRIIVAAGAGWHPGVVGIVAARLVEAFHRPAVVIGVNDGIGRGSCRSVPGFDIGQAVCSLQPLLLRAGGHALAAGLTIEESRIDEFRRALQDLADREVPEDLLVPRLRVEAIAEPPELTLDLVAQLQALQPHGVGNPEPVFALIAVRVVEVRRVGRAEDHLQITFERDGVRLPAIWWGGATGEFVPANDDLVDVAFTLALDERRRTPRLKVRDVRRAAMEGGS